MASRSLPRRRTRVYDCNYNMGQRYYQSALDGLDKKYSTTSTGTAGAAASTTESVLDRIRSQTKADTDVMFEEDLRTARRRAEKAMAGGEDSAFDSRGQRMQMGSGITSLSALEDDFDEELHASLNRIRASKKMSSMNDDMEDTISTVKRRARIDLGSKLLDSAGDDEFGASMRRKAVKMLTTSSTTSRSSDDMGSMTKWTAVDDAGATTGASLRAQATKARLDDIEADMFDRSERQAARDRRNAHMKKVLAENDLDSEVMAMKSMKVTTKSEKKVTF